MRNLKLSLCFVLLLFISVSCTNKNNQLIEFKPLEFSAYEPLPYDVITDSLPIYPLFQMIIQDSMIIIKGKDSKSNFFIYDKNTGKKIKSFYLLGKGPGEGVYPKNICCIGNDTYLTLETNLRKWVYVDMKKLLAGDEQPYTEIKMKFPEDKNILMMDFFLHDKGNQFIVNSPYGENERFKKISIGEGDKIEDINLYRTCPKVIEETDDYNKVIFCYGNFVATSPDRTKLANLTILGAIAETFDLEQDTMKLRAVKGINKPMYEKDPNPDNIWLSMRNDAEIGFTGIIATNDYIYGIYSGVDYTQELCQVRIVVFDWDLNHIKTYKSEDLLLQIAKDTETGDVYAAIKSKETGEYQLVRFKDKFAI